MVDEVFSYEDGGFPGDEDNGTMAAWYIFTVLGIYPMCPGKAEFTVIKPMVDLAELFINGQWVDILAPQAGKNKVAYDTLIAKKKTK